MQNLQNRRVAPTSGVGASVGATWVYTLGSIVFFYVLLYFLIITQAIEGLWARQGPADVALLMVLVAAAVVQIRFCWFLREGPEQNLAPGRWFVALCGTAIVAWAFSFGIPSAGLYAVAPVWLAAALVVCLVPRGRRLFVLGVAAVIVAIPVLVHGSGSYLAELMGRGGPGFWLLAMYCGLMPAMTLTTLWGWWVVQRLDESRAVAAELAVAQERLRFASDLHDIQGHHLQVIALKAELAERMLTSQPSEAGAQIGEIRVIAKQALEETRALVAGMREVSLEDELENAREVLTLAGATCNLELAAVPLTAESRRVLALAVREATTNILRHSDADAAQITLVSVRGGAQLRVTNNGVTEARADSVDDMAAEGTGLRGTRERLEALNGRLHTARGADEFMFEVWVPAAHSEGDSR